MNDDLTPEQLLGTGFFGLCCCLFAAVGLIGTVVWLMRREKQAAPPVPPPPLQSAGEFHLSVLALAFDAGLRAQVEAALAMAGAVLDPVAARVWLVQRVARVLLDVSPHWRRCGYGEKELLEISLAQQSYAAALTDFRARAAQPADGGGLVVVTLILCTRGRRLGVDRLETRAQIHDLLNDRLRLEPGQLLGAEVVWAPSAGALSHEAVAHRFPETHGIDL